MYSRCQNNVSKEIKVSFLIVDFGGCEKINMEQFQEMYLNPSTNMSPIANGPSTLSPSPFTPPTSATILPMQQSESNREDLLKVLSIIGSENNCSNIQLQQRFAGNYPSRGQVTSNTTGKSSNHDEISKSLQRLAKTAYSTEEQRFPPSRVEVVMQDFACNGRISDDINNYQQLNMANMSNSSNFVNNNNNIINELNQSYLSQLYLHLHQQQLQQLSMNLNMWQSIYKMAPPMQLNNSYISPITTTATTTTTGTSNIDYNISNNNQLKCSKKLPKRYNNSIKNDKSSGVKHCVFCENNNEPDAVVKSHALRDAHGKVLCPKLRTYICPICKASGDYAHTIKYCPEKPIVTMEDTVKAESFRLTKTNFYKPQMKV